MSMRIRKGYRQTREPATSVKCRGLLFQEREICNELGRSSDIVPRHQPVADLNVLHGSLRRGLRSEFRINARRNARRFTLRI